MPARWSAPGSPGRRQPASASAATGCEGWTRNHRAGPWGSHQFQRPKSDTAAGTSSALITVASNRMPAAAG